MYGSFNLDTFSLFTLVFFHLFNFDLILSFKNLRGNNKNCAFFQKRFADLLFTINVSLEYLSIEVLIILFMSVRSIQFNQSTATEIQRERKKEREREESQRERKRRLPVSSRKKNIKQAYSPCTYSQHTIIAKNVYITE